MQGTPPPQDSSAEAREGKGVHLRTLWSYIRPHWRLMLLGGILGLAGNAASLAQPLAAKWVIDSVGEGAFGAAPLVALTGLVVLGGVLAAAGAYVLERMSAWVVHGVRAGMVRHILRLRVGVLDRPGDLISRVTADTTLLSRVASRSFVDAANSVLMLAGGIALMAYLDLLLLGVTLLVFTLILAVAGVAMPRIARAQERAQSAVGEIGSGLERVLGAFRTIKANGVEGRESRRLVRATDTARDHVVTSAKWTALARVAAGLVTQVAFLSVLGIGGVRVAAGDLEVSTLVAFLLYLFSLTQPIGMLVQGLTDLQSGLAAVRRVRHVEELPQEKAEGTNTPWAKGPASLEMEKVSFSYTPNEPVLDRVGFQVGAGSTVALVGESGGGKTTIFSLVERFYEPDAGRLLLDGVDLREWSLGDLRAQISYVEQDAPVLEGTLWENLTLARPLESEDRVREVLARTRLEHTVERMPQGLHTHVGHRGATLSGGQRQRIAIARALLREPRLLLLDEATSQLDAENEIALRETIAELSRTTTVLLIAHRLSTVVGADHIILLDQGRVRASGTHSELLDDDTFYARLSGAQRVSG